MADNIQFKRVSQGGSSGDGGAGKCVWQGGVLCTEIFSFPCIMDWLHPTRHPLYDKYDPSSGQINPVYHP